MAYGKINISSGSIDTSNATAGTDKFVSGTATRKSTSALTINTGLDKIKGLIVFTPEHSGSTYSAGFVYSDVGVFYLQHLHSTLAETGEIKIIEDGSSYISIDGGVFTGTYSSSSYPFYSGTNAYSWIAWGDGTDQNDTLEDRDIYIKGNSIVQDTTLLNIETGLDSINGIIVYCPPSFKKGYTIGCVYSNTTKMMIKYNSAGQTNYVEDESLITVSGGTVSLNQISSIEPFYSDGSYSWVAWGDGSIVGSGGELDTSDATATAGDIAEGCTAYVNGSKITGTVKVGYPIEVPNTTTVSYYNSTLSGITIKGLNVQTTADEDKLVREGTSYSIAVSGDKLGNATAADVVAGKTFTSINGLKVTGTHSCSSGSSGTNTNDATAAAGDILSGKTAYVKGNKITGTIASQAAQTITPSTSNKTIAAGKYLSGTQTIKGDANLVAANIKSGVSIFGVTGSYTGSSSSGGGSSTNNCEAYHITSTSTTINFQGSGTVKVFGYGYKKVSTYQSTVYAFVGDGYYTGTSYGTPTKTAASFSVSGGTLSGLPSGLTKVDLLVVIGV